MDWYLCKYIGIDVLRKWNYIYNECRKKNIVVVGSLVDYRMEIYLCCFGWGVDRIVLGLVILWYFVYYCGRFAYCCRFILRRYSFLISIRHLCHAQLFLGSCLIFTISVRVHAHVRVHGHVRGHGRCIHYIFHLRTKNYGYNFEMSLDSYYVSIFLLTIFYEVKSGL